MTSSNVLFVHNPKGVQFTVTEEEINEEKYAYLRSWNQRIVTFISLNLPPTVAIILFTHFEIHRSLEGETGVR